MKFGRTVLSALLALLLLSTLAAADQIILRDETIYTGTFIRGDSKTVDFRILGRTEHFQISDIARIVFSEPEPAVADARTVAPEPAPPLPEPLPEAAEATSPASDSGPGVGGGVPDGSRPKPEYEANTALTLTFPEGTPIVVRTTTAIDTDRNRVGDVFEAILDEPLEIGGNVFAPRGAKARGRIASAEESGKLSGRAQLMLELTELTVGGRSYFIRTADHVQEGASRTKSTAATVGGTAVLGAIIGAIAGGGRGAAIGAASGAGVGTGVQILTQGEVLKIPAETVLEFRLRFPVTVDLLDGFPQ